MDMMYRAVRQISIHALREEGDAHEVIALGFHRIFLSTPSARRATIPPCFFQTPFEISIHALREEGDLFHGRNQVRRCISIHALREEGDEDESLRVEVDKYFYPRPPRGGRRFLPRS